MSVTQMDMIDRTGCYRNNLVEPLKETRCYRTRDERMGRKDKVEAWKLAGVLPFVSCCLLLFSWVQSHSTPPSFFTVTFHHVGSSCYFLPYSFSCLMKPPENSSSIADQRLPSSLGGGAPLHLRIDMLKDTPANMCQDPPEATARSHQDSHSDNLLASTCEALPEACPREEAAHLKHVLPTLTEEGLI